MATLTRTAFLQEMSNKSIKLSQAASDSQLSKINLATLDRNHSGLISGESEMKALFRAIDYYDSNGTYQSVDLGSTQHPTQAGLMINAARQLARSSNTNPQGSNQMKDTALKNAFGSHFSGEVKRGDKGDKSVAIQYALGRLGHLHYICDGDFGGLTEAAVKSFQQATNTLPVTGIVDTETLSMLDAVVSSKNFQPPVFRSDLDPLTYLSDFDALGMPKISINTTSETADSWESKHIQKAFGNFVEHYWEVMKTNRVEADCKSLALFFMDQFRKQLAMDTFIELPLPRSSHGSFGKQQWSVSTPDKTKGLFSRADDLYAKEGTRVGRSGYKAVKNIEKLDPDHSMIYGVNVKYPRTSADQVSKAATVVGDWSTSRSNHGNHKKPEISINKLKPGYLIFINHTGDRSYDHTITVVKVKKDSNQRVRQVVMAVGSYDDVRDSSSATHVNRSSILNQYAEEVTVDFDKNGMITSSKNTEVTYASEPDYIVKPRYHAGNTLMEKRGGGKIKIARWGQ